MMLHEQTVAPMLGGPADGYEFKRAEVTLGRPEFLRSVSYPVYDGPRLSLRDIASYEWDKPLRHTFVRYLLQAYRCGGEIFCVYLPDDADLRDPQWDRRVLAWIADHGDEGWRLWAAQERDRKDGVRSLIRIPSDRLAEILGLS